MFSTSRLCLGLAALALRASAACAAPGDTPTDYSHTMPLTTSGKQSVVQLRLPSAVYRYARSPQLADLRLFDATGAALPFALSDGLPLARESRTVQPAAVFPVFAPAAERAGSLDGLQVQTSADGSVISVTTRTGGGASRGQPLASLVLDLLPQGADRQAAGDVAALALTLPDGVRNYSARVAVDVSDDLQDWEPLADANVSWLVNSAGATVRSDRIAFPPRAFRYARIRWLEGEPIEFAAVGAERVGQVAGAQPWDSLVVQPQATQDARDLMYAAPLAIPVRALGLVLHKDNVVLPAAIGRYVERPGAPDANGAPDFRPLASATFYRLTQDGKLRASGDVAVPETHAARWIVRLHGAAADRPDLRLSWQPATLVFVASGKGPYRLAFGRAGAASTALALDQVAPGFTPQELAALEQARAGEPVAAQPGDAGAAQDAGAAAARGRVFGLWALLLAGVGVLGWMAWRLARQLKQEGGDQGRSG